MLMRHALVPRPVEEAAATFSLYDATLQRLRYWHEPENEAPRRDKYIAFNTDRGGLNNIRIALEYAVIFAYVTRRTLILPPASPWYLIDWGPIKRGTPAGGTTRYDEFFDLRSLRAAVPVIGPEEFVARESSRLHIRRGDAEVLHRQLDPPIIALSGGHNTTWRCTARSITPSTG